MTLTEVILLKSNMRGHKEQIRATRVKVEYRCFVKSLGEGIRYYTFYTKDFSETGIYLVGDKAKYEFTNSSLLEVGLCTPEDNQINFITKIIRKTNENEFGLKIVQIDRPAADKLHKLIKHLLQLPI
jgi:hypothetical protein